MSTADHRRIRQSVAKHLAAGSAALPTSMLARASRTALGMARAGAFTLEQALRRGEPNLDRMSALVASIGQLKGVTMKLGQVLGALDLGLQPELRAALSALHTASQPVPLETVRGVLQRELGPRAAELLRSLDPAPLCAGSIGQVHRAALPDGTKVAVKVAYPGIEETITRDLGVATLGSRLAAWILPGSPLDAFAREVRARVLEECDYALEARRQERFAQLYAWHATIHVPAVHRAYSSAKVLTSTFVEGLHLDAFLAANPSEAARNRAGEALFEFYLGSLFRHGLYACDPHPGNALFTADGGVTFLDFGCAAEFETGFVDRLAALTQAVASRDRGLLENALAALGMIRRGEAPDLDRAERALRSFFGPMLEDAVTAFELEPGLGVRDVLGGGRGVRGLALPGELLFVTRTAMGLAAALTRLGARANWHRLLQGSLAAHAARAATAQPAGELRAGAPATAARPSRPGKAAGAAFYDVVLVAPGEDVIAVVRVVREATGLSLRDAKDLVDLHPRPVSQRAPAAEADALRERLEAAGATVTLEPIR